MATAFFNSPTKMPCLTAFRPPDIDLRHPVELLTEMIQERTDRGILKPVDLLNEILLDNPESPLFCGNCEEDARASSRCKNCDELLCDNCVRAHVRVKLTKDHSIFPIGISSSSSYLGIPGAINGSSPNSLLTDIDKNCCSHHQETMQVYCESCGVIFCLECNSEHNGHKYVLLHEALDCARSSSLKFLSEAKMNTLAVKESLEISERMQDSVNSKSQIVTREIRNMMHRFHMAIEERETELLESLKQIVFSKYKAIQNQIKTFRTLFSGFSEASRDLSDVLESGAPIDIIKVRDHVSAKLNRLRSMRSNMVQVDDTIQIIPPDWSILLAISSMGGIAGYSQTALEQSSMIGEDSFRVTVSPSLNQNDNYAHDISKIKKSLSSLSLLGTELPLGHRPMETTSKVIRPPILPAHNYIQRDYTNAGVPVLVIGGEGDEDGKLCRPWGVCCSLEGNIIVADRSNNRIQIFLPDGNFLFKFGVHGSEPGCFDRPAGVTVDIHDRIVVADKDNHRIQVFSNKGDFIYTFGEKGSKAGQFNYPWDVAVDAHGRIAVSDSRNHRIQLFDSNGKYIAKYGFDVTPNSIKQFDSPRGICFTSNGFVIVTDFNNHRLVVIDPTFNNGRFIGTEGTGEKQFSRPQGIAVDPAGNIIVADSRNNRIQVFAQRGNFICEFGCAGKEPGKLDRPSGLCLSPTGQIVVVDFGNNRVQVF